MKFPHSEGKSHILLLKKCADLFLKTVLEELAKATTGKYLKQATINEAFEKRTKKTKGALEVELLHCLFKETRRIDDATLAADGYKYKKWKSLHDLGFVWDASEVVWEDMSADLYKKNKRLFSVLLSETWMSLESKKRTRSDTVEDRPKGKEPKKKAKASSSSSSSPTPVATAGSSSSSSSSSTTPAATGRLADTGRICSLSTLGMGGIGMTGGLAETGLAATNSPVVINNSNVVFTIRDSFVTLRDSISFLVKDRNSKAKELYKCRKELSECKKDLEKYKKFKALLEALNPPKQN
jgi:hypothetical protein